MLRAPTRSSKKGLSRFRIPILVCSSLALLAITLHLWSTPLQGGVQTLSDRWYQTSHHPQNYAIPPPNSHAYLKHSVPPSAMAGQYHTNLTYQDTVRLVGEPGGWPGSPGFNLAWHDEVHRAEAVLQ